MFLATIAHLGESYCLTYTLHQIASRIMATVLRTPPHQRAHVGTSRMGKLTRIIFQYQGAEREAERVVQSVSLAIDVVNYYSKA